MKNIFLFISLFLFKTGLCQSYDSLYKIMEERRLSSDEFAGDVTGKLMSEFAAKDLQGVTYSVKDFRRWRVTFANLWYLSCAPCIAEIPNLNRLYSMVEKNAKVQFFAITFESETNVRAAIEKYGIRYPILLTTAKELRMMNFGIGYPTSMVLDQDGKVFKIISGGLLNPGPEFELYWNWQIQNSTRVQKKRKDPTSN